MDTKVNNEIGSFVVVGAIEGDSDTPIWIGRVLSTILDESGNVSKLQVHRFDTRSVEQSLSGR